MEFVHNTRESAYRSPYGAVPVGSELRLFIQVKDASVKTCELRTWVDGQGEKLMPMEVDENGFHLLFPLEEKTIVWYFFKLWMEDGTLLYYGAKQGKQGGVGELYSHEPPSFQVTVYELMSIPGWYKNGVVYQIFPDRFHRGTHWREDFQNAFLTKKHGPGHRLVKDWNTLPSYEKDEQGRIQNWDFYGGTLEGIEEKLDYLRDLGVTVLYLNPIFEASSNHRYDTGNYEEIELSLGGNVAFDSLLKKAKEKGISIILDGVFNHCGCDSIYFNRYGNYPTQGAYQSQDSKYRDWFSFAKDGTYDSWWGVDDLPSYRTNSTSVQHYLLSILEKWSKKGVKGWRLDVADELSEDFLVNIHDTIQKTLGKEGLVIGEVWEDASNKISYGSLRHYLLGDELHGVMNYPWRDGIQNFLLSKISAYDIAEILESLQENYPKECLQANLNIMSSHDSIRSRTKLSKNRKEESLVKARVWLMLILQMTLPGVPSIYYGDEVGVEGLEDPMNRASYPWDKEDPDFFTMYKEAIALRKSNTLFQNGSLTCYALQEDVFAYVRKNEQEACLVIINRSCHESHSFEVPSFSSFGVDLLTGDSFEERDGHISGVLHPLQARVISFCAATSLAKPMRKGKGILMHISSLPNEKGLGTIGGEAREFIDEISKQGYSYWQILPIHPTDEHGSPYDGTSAFAANMNLFPKTIEELREEFHRFKPTKSFQEFCQKEAFWLEDYAYFLTLHEKYSLPWPNWPTEKKSFFSKTKKEMEFHQYCQYRFDQEWKALLNYAHSRGIEIIGDLPMYVSLDSSDVYAHRELFTLDQEGNQSAQAGVPGDYFAKDGQLWGNPLYRWDIHKAQGYDWWKKRLRRCFELYDFIRLDHFRGFDTYWSIPQGKTANEGSWKGGPGYDFFQSLYQEFGPLSIIAEDLGSLTASVRYLVHRCGFPGMAVLQFQNEDPLDHEFHALHKIAYTGTHDNQTLVGWCQSRYPQLDSKKLAQEFVEKVQRSSSLVSIVPMQDLLRLDDDSRMNQPGTVGKNWQWQLTQEQWLRFKQRSQTDEGD